MFFFVLKNQREEGEVLIYLNEHNLDFACCLFFANVNVVKSKEIVQGGAACGC